MWISRLEWHMNSCDIGASPSSPTITALNQVTHHSSGFSAWSR